MKPSRWPTVVWWLIAVLAVLLAYPIYAILLLLFACSGAASC